MDRIEIISIIAGILTTGSFIPQAVRIIRTKETKGISIAMYAIMCSGIFLWMLYGIFTWQVPMIAANGVTLALSMVILGLKLRYK